MIIMNLLNQIKEKEVVLPAIQRSFVWSERDIRMLLDSMMRGYPVGIALLWETYDDIQFRHFIDDYRGEKGYAFQGNSARKRFKVVLDGQQRLQSLYIALFGRHMGRHLYFDILSGYETQDFREERFVFDFCTEEDANRRNDEEASEFAADTDSVAGVSDESAEEDEDGHVPSWFVKARDLFSWPAKTKRRLRKKVVEEFGLDDDDDMRIEANLSRFDEVLTKDDNILKVATLDENLAKGSPDRKSESDVLEVFVRVNRQGTTLSRSDLIFSMLKLNWRKSAEALPEFVESINEGNSFDIDTDFVIRCLYAVSGLGTKFNVDVLRRQTNVDTIKQHFGRCCDAIRSTVDFVQGDCWCASSKLVSGLNTLVPFVYYLFHTPGRQIPKNRLGDARKALFLFAFSGEFSRYGDSRLGKFIRRELKPLLEDGDYAFPYLAALDWISYWAGIKNYGPEFIQRNVPLALHIVQHKTGAKVHYRLNAPEVDHIFPRSVLRKRRLDESLINHFANFWILGKNKNQNKSNAHPKKYFRDVSDAELRRALIERTYLDYRRYKAFLRHRSAKILDHVRREVGFADSDFDALTEEAEEE